MPLSRKGEWHLLLVSLNFSWLDKSLLGNEDSIKEFTLILASNSADLLDLGAAKGESGVIDTVENELSLDIVTVSDLGASLHCDKLVLLSTEEVLNSDAGTVLGDDDVDGEMSVYQSHFVAEALSDTDDHVADEGLKGVDSARLLVPAE